MNANPKNLRRGDLITVVPKPGSKETLIRGDRMRVLSVALPFIFVDRWCWHKREFISSPWNVDTNDYNVVRIHRNAVTPF